MKGSSFFRLKRPQRQGGFGLIEIMLGLALGLLVVLGVVKIYASWDARQRNVGAKNDAQMVASIAVHALEQDIRMAGRGFGSADPAALGCSITAFVAPATPQSVTFPLVPLLITDGAAGAPDQITVLHGNSAIRVINDYVVDSTATSKTVLNRGGFLAGDKVLLTNSKESPVACALVEITNRSTTDQVSFSHLTTAYTSGYAAADSTELTMPTMNTDAGTGTAKFNGGLIHNLGPVPQLNLWALTTPATQPSVWTLSRTNRLPMNSADASPYEVAEGIVNLQAQYGYDANNDGMLASDEWIDPSAMPASIIWSQVLAVRFAILARSSHYEPPPYRAAQPFWAGGNFVMTDLSGGVDSDSAGANNWRSYRYQVLEAVVPLRNYLQQWRD
jgi:type IV pilus assembly protein PilW